MAISNEVKVISIDLPQEIMGRKDLSIEIIVGYVAVELKRKLKNIKYRYTKDSVDGCKIHRAESGLPIRIDYRVSRDTKDRGFKECKRTKKYAKATREKTAEVHGGV